MTTSGSNQDDENSEGAQKRPQTRADRLKWMNNPETVHSMTDVAEENPDVPAGDGSAFCLTEGESVIASKTTARAEAAAREQAWEEAIVSTNQISLSAADEPPSTDQLLSKWSGQKQARKARGPALQEEIIKRIRNEIDLELEQIRLSGYSLGSTLILMGRTFGQDPSQWLPAEKVSQSLYRSSSLFGGPGFALGV